MNHKDWFRHVATYGVGGILLNGLSFFLLPLYTRSITPAEYGTLELLNRTSELSQLILLAGMLMATITTYQHEADYPHDQRTVFPTAITALLAIGAVAIIVVWMLSNPIAFYLLGTSDLAWAVRLIAIITISEAAYALSLLLLQAKLQSHLYVMATIGRLLFGVAINIYLVAKQKMGLRGILVASLLHTVIFGGGMSIYAYRSEGFRFRWQMFRKLLHIGLPLVPASLCLFVLNNVDRFFIRISHGNEELGLYGLGYKIGTLGVMLVLTPFLKVWGATMIRVGSGDKGGGRIALAATYFTFAYMTVSVAIAVWTPMMLRFLVPASYWASYNIVPLILLAYLFWGHATIADTPFYLAKRVGAKPVLMALSATAVLFFYSTLIPRYGSLGGALATLFGFGLLAAITRWKSSQLIPIPYENLRLTTLVLAGVLAFGFVKLLESWTAVRGSLLAYACCALVTTLAYPAFAILILSNKEEKFLLSQVLKKLRKNPWKASARVEHAQL